MIALLDATRWEFTATEKFLIERDGKIRPELFWLAEDACYDTGRKFFAE